MRLGAPILNLRSECSREGGGRLVAPGGDRIATHRPGGHEQGTVPYAVGLSTAARTCSESLASVGAILEGHAGGENCTGALA